MSEEMIHPHVATCSDPDCLVCDSSDGLSYAARRQAVTTAMGGAAGTMPARVTEATGD